MAQDRPKFPSGSNYAQLQIRKDIHEAMSKVARLRGMNLQELFEDFLEECVEDYELDECGIDGFSSRE